MTDASGRLSRWLVPLIDSARNHTENQVLHGVRHRAEAGNPGLDQVDHAHFIDAQEEPAVVQLAERVKTDHDPDRPQDPGAHTYNDPAYAAIEGGAPVWMTNVMEAVGDRHTRLSITLDGMPNSAGDRGNWNTPESIVEAFRRAVADGSPYSTREGNRPEGGRHGVGDEHCRSQCADARS